MPLRDRQVPPGRARVAAAARAGLVPRTGRLVAGVVLLAASGALAFAGARPAAYFRAIVDAGIRSAVLGRADPAAALWGSVVSACRESAWLFLLCFAAAAAVSVLPAVWARGRGGRTAVPLPDVRPGRFAGPVLGLFGAGLFLLLALHIGQKCAGAVWDLMDGDLSAIAALGSGAVQLLAAGGFVLVLIGLAEWLLSRHAIWRALFLTGAESRTEQRAAGEESPVKRALAGRARAGAGR